MVTMEAGKVNYLFYDRERMDIMSLAQPKRTYLAGPMSGRPHWNYPEFMKAAAHLRENGHYVFNPA